MHSDDDDDDDDDDYDDIRLAVCSGLTLLLRRQESFRIVKKLTVGSNMLVMVI